MILSETSQLVSSCQICSDSTHFLCVSSLGRVFHEMFTNESQCSVDPLTSSNGPHPSEQAKRPLSWTRTVPLFQSRARSGKFCLEKMRGVKSEGDKSDGVMLASVTDLVQTGNAHGRTCQQEVKLLDNEKISPNSLSLIPTFLCPCLCQSLYMYLCPCPCPCPCRCQCQFG